MKAVANATLTIPLPAQDLTAECLQGDNYYHGSYY